MNSILCISAQKEHTGRSAASHRRHPGNTGLRGDAQWDQSVF
jgi:hypothetical protein